MRSNDVQAARLTLEGGPFNFSSAALLLPTFKSALSKQKKDPLLPFWHDSAHIVGQIGGWHRIRLQHSPRRAAPIYARIRPSHQRMGSRTFRVSISYSYHAQFQDTFFQGLIRLAQREQRRQHQTQKVQTANTLPSLCTTKGKSPLQPSPLWNTRISRKLLAEKWQEPYNCTAKIPNVPSSLFHLLPFLR